MESIAKILFAIHKTQILTYYVQQENRQPSKWLHKYEEFEAETSNNMIWPTPYFHIFYASETKVRDALKKRARKVTKWMTTHVYQSGSNQIMCTTVTYIWTFILRSDTKSTHCEYTYMHTLLLLLPFSIC